LEIGRKTKRIIEGFLDNVEASTRRGAEEGKYLTGGTGN
jgi:hypothetical protein